MPRNWRPQARLGLIVGVCISALVALILTPKIRLGAGYHDFADTRIVFGLPHALDVLSNVPFIVVGMWGLLWLLGDTSRLSFLDMRERTPYFVFFAGVALTGTGSFCYHLSPSNSRLPWDLIPMACCFETLVVALFMERVNVRIGLICLVPLLLLGVASVAEWYWSEARGLGDYKFYLFVQFFSPVVVALILVLFPSPYSGTRYLAAAFALFVAAKLFESLDRAIYSLGEIVSGHSLKHVTAAISCYLILRMLQVRRVMPVAQASGAFRMNDAVSPGRVWL